LVKDFAAYLDDRRDQIDALTIFYGQPARRSQVTYGMIKAVLDSLTIDRPKLAPLRVWRAYALVDEYKEAIEYKIEPEPNPATSDPTKGNPP
jgi:type I restriction enzyme, R subunit